MTTSGPSAATLAKYGLTLEEYLDMLCKQLDACAICRRAFSATRPALIDHDHAHGHVLREVRVVDEFEDVE